MKTALSVLLLSTLAAAALAQDYEPVKIGNQYGFSRDGRILIPARYDYVTHFREARALVRQAGKWGFIDSTGAWIVQPIFDNAEMFSNGRARVYRDGKAGMIDNNGAYIVEPLYPSFEESWYGYIVSDPPYVGYVSGNVRIPVKYLDFSFDGDFVAGQNSLTSYDLYFRDSLILQNMSAPLSPYYDEQNGLDQAVVSVDGKAGVIASDGSWVIQPVYSRIACVRIGSFYDAEGEEHARLLYRLDNSEYIAEGDEEYPSYELVGPKILYLAKTDGTLIHDKPFSDVDDYVDQTTQRLKVELDGKIAYIEPDLSLTVTPYVSMIDHGGGKIAKGDSQTWILDGYGNVTAVFDDAEIPDTYTMDEQFSAAGRTSRYTYNSPYLIVRKKSGERAIYDLADRKLLTDWSVAQPDVDRCYEINEDHIYFLSDRRKRMAFYHSAMGAASAFVFGALRMTDGKHVVGMRSENGENVLFAVDAVNGFRELLNAPEIRLSFDLVQQEQFQYNEEAARSLFTGTFFVYKAANGKYGIVTEKNVVVPAIYDTLIQNASMGHILDASVGGRWGSIDIRNGNTVQPQFSKPLSFVYSEYRDLDYALCEDEMCYISSAGKRFYSASESFVFKSGGRYGIKMHTDFPDESNMRENYSDEIVSVPPVYKEIRLTDYPNRFIAKGSNGKYGMITALNDTLVPFVYASIGFPSDESVMELASFETKIGKKTGLIAHVDSKQLPAIYDRYAIWTGSSNAGTAVGLQVWSGEKTGLVDMAFNPVLSVEYDAIWLYGAADYTQLFELRALKSGKWYVLPFCSPETISERALMARPGFDLVVDNYGYIRTAGGYDRYDAASGELVARNVDEATMLGQDVEEGHKLFLKNGLIGAVGYDGKVLLKPSLTNVKRFDGDTLLSVKNGELAYFIVIMNKQYNARQW